jgi:hypothetical protein
MALSCLRYLNFSLALARRHTIEDPRTIDIGKCLYVLQPYVHEHWLDHVLALAAELPSTRDSHLEQHLNRLLSTFHQYSPHVGGSPVHSSNREPMTGLDLDPRLGYIRQYGHVFEALSRTVQYHHVRKLHFHDPSSTGKNSSILHASTNSHR